MSLRVALVDDQALVREGLKALLRDLGFIVAIESEDATALLDVLGTQQFDVIVSDIRMPGMSGIDLVRELRTRKIAIPVVLLTTFDDHELLPAAAQAGANGFLVKDASPDELREAIQRAHQGEPWLSPVATDRVRWRRSEIVTPQDVPPFTERELSILRLLAGGYSNKEIARTLNLAEGTIKNYVSEILEKLDTPDRTRAVLKAISARII